MHRREREAFPTAFQAALLYVALFLCEIVIGALLRDLRGLHGLSPEQASVIALVIANGCVFAFVMQAQGIGYRNLFHPSSVPARVIFARLVPPVLLLVPGLMLAMSVALELLVRIAPYSAWEETMFQRMGSGGIAPMLATCLLAPVLEEMLFRGIVLRGFLKQYPRWQAILGSAVLFGAAHLNIYQFVVGVVLGTVLGWLYDRTRSLIPCIALHGAYNSGLMALSALLRSRESAPSSAGIAAIWLFSLVAAICGTVALRRMLANKPFQ
jgi:hypothetical protein